MIRKRVLIVFIALLISVRGFSDKLEKGFERLSVYDYFRAKEYFEETIKKKTPGAAFGLSLIYSTDNNPFYNLDSARRYILLCDSSFKSLKEKEKKNYEVFHITTATIQSTKDSICEKSFNTAKFLSTVERWNNYIRDFDFCSQLSEAVILRNSIAYKNARIANTAAAYKTFLDTYPGAKEQRDARSHYDERVYEEATSEKTIPAYQKYISDYPGSPYEMQAEKMIYTLSTPHKTVGEYYSFIKKFPQSKLVEEAWRELFKIYTKDYSEQVFVNFKRQFPDYPYKDELETDYELHRSFFLPFTKNGKWGFINEEGKEMIRPEYDEVSLFSEGLAGVEKEGKYGFVNKAGKVIIPCMYEDAESFKSNAVIVKKDGKSGLISRTGEELIPFSYDDLSEQEEGFYVAVMNEKSAYITKSGKKLTDFIFDFAGDFHEGYSIAGMDDKYGLLNNACSFVIEPLYDELLFMSNHLLKARQNGHWGIINVHGEVIASFIYDAIGDFNSNRALVVKNKKCGFIDETGKSVIPVNYPFQESLISTTYFKNGYVVLKQKTKSVLLDSLGTKISFSGFEDLGFPAEGLIPVKKNRKWGFADMKGKLKIACSYSKAGSFEDGYARVKLNKSAGIIDSAGKIVVPFTYEDVFAENKYFLASKDGKTGLISKEGMQLLAPEYERIEFISDKIVSATDDKRILYLNLLTGKVIWEEKE